MARLADIPVVLRKMGPWGFTKQVWQQINEDNLLAWAASLAYSWLFAVFPFMIFLLTLLPYLPARTKTAAEDEIRQMVYEYAPQSAADTIWNNVTEILHNRHTALLSFGLGLAIWGASGGINMTISALDRCYELDQGRPFYRQRPWAIVLTIGVAVLIIAVLVLLPIGSVVVDWVEKHGNKYVSMPLILGWKIARYPLALLMMFSVVNILYHWGPSIKQRFSYITPGAVFAVTVWILLAVGFRLYVDKFGKFNETYGTVGGVAILLLAFYIDAYVLLVGAEINSEIDFAVLGVPRGSRDFRTPCEVKGECAIPQEASGKQISTAPPPASEPSPAFPGSIADR